MLAAAIAASMTNSSTSPEGAAEGGEGDNEEEKDDDEMLAAAIAASMTSSSPTAQEPASTGGGTNANPLSTDAMTSLLQAMFQAQQQRPQAPTIVPLNTVLTPESFSQLLEDPKIVEALLPFLPEGQQTEEELRQTFSSPQLQQSLRSLTNALLSNNYNAVLANFGLDAAAGADAMAQGNPVLAFIQALQEQADRNQGNKE